MMTGVPQTVDCGEYCTAFTRTPHQICLIWDDYLPCSWPENYICPSAAIRNEGVTVGKLMLCQFYQYYRAVWNRMAKNPYRAPAASCTRCSYRESSVWPLSAFDSGQTENPRKWCKQGMSICLIYQAGQTIARTNGPGSKTYLKIVSPRLWKAISGQHCWLFTPRFCIKVKEGTFLSALTHWIAKEKT